MGQVAIEPAGAGFVLCHRDDAGHLGLTNYSSPEDAAEIARLDEAGNFRPLKTAPNLQRGWRLELANLAGVRRALDYFYPGRLGVWIAAGEGRIRSTSLRETLNRQTGMYRIAASISDDVADRVVGEVCQSNTGCLRTILWSRDEAGGPASTKLPSSKFDLDRGQANESASSPIPLLCQEACAILVGACRAAVKGGKDDTAEA
jgi:sirohydrochlorin cobaltochelatase